MRWFRLNCTSFSGWKKRCFRCSSVSRWSDSFNGFNELQTRSFQVVFCFKIFFIPGQLLLNGSSKGKDERRKKTQKIRGHKDHSSIGPAEVSSANRQLLMTMEQRQQSQANSKLLGISPLLSGYSPFYERQSCHGETFRIFLFFKIFFLKTRS